MNSLKCLIALVMIAVAAPLFADQPPHLLPPGKGQYVMILRDPVPSAPSDPKRDVVEVPDVAKLGGSVVVGHDRRHVIIIPNAAAKALRHNPNVAVLQRLWMGETAEEWAETESAAEGPDVASQFEETGSTWTTGTYAYDSSGNIKGVGGNEYFYDSANRLVKSVVDGVTETYRYDSFGNLTEKTTANSTTTIPVNSSNRVAGEVYDEIGNMTTKGGAVRYDYDALGMVSAVRGSSAFRHLDRRMIYTPDDERIGVMWDTENSIGPDNTWHGYWTIRDFSGRPLRQYSHSVYTDLWTWERDYVYEEGRLVGGERVGTLDKGPSSNGTVHFHLDHLGSVRMITDSQGMRYGRHDYYPFGGEQTSSIQEVMNFAHDSVEPLRFTGHERDYHGYSNVENTDYLDFMHARQYDPNLGRFLSVDPLLGNLGQPQSWNRYAYVYNNPANLIDPRGLAARVAGEKMEPGDTCSGMVVEGWCIRGYDITVARKAPPPDYGRTSRFFIDWLFERGASDRFYGMDSTETGEMARSRGADQMRQEYAAGDCASSAFAPGRPGGLSGSYGTADAYLETIADLNWAGNNLTQFQVGGYLYGYENLGNGKVMYSMYNQASMYSLLYHLPGVPHKPRGGAFPFMGNINQYFRWVEPNPPECQ